jgi:hypothetical protein
MIELADGSLDEACFKFYIVQGALPPVRPAVLLPLSFRAALRFGAVQYGVVRFWCGAAQCKPSALVLLKSQLLCLSCPKNVHLPSCSEYARALALVASKAPLPAWTNFFCHCANDAYLEEATFHTVSQKIKCCMLPLD